MNNTFSSAFLLPPDVLSVEATDDFFLNISFSDGYTTRFDFKPFLSWKCYSKLSDPAVFKSAFVDYGTVVWPGNIDVDPEILYVKGK